MNLANLPQRDFEQAIGGFDVEVGTAYRQDGTQAFPPRIGERNRVDFPSPDEVDLFDTIFVHNHPDVRRISNGDLTEAARHRARGIVAILPDGTALRLTVPEPNDWPLDELRGRQDMIENEASARFGYGLDPGPLLDAKHRWMIAAQAEVFSQIGVIMIVEPLSDDEE